MSPSSSRQGIECHLIDPGARNSLHLVPQMDMAIHICKLMEISKGDKAKTEKYGKVASEGGEDIRAIVQGHNLLN